MSMTVFYKLLAIIVVVALGWVVGRTRWLTPADANPTVSPSRNAYASTNTSTTTNVEESADPTRTLSNAALYVFIPALLLRTTARVDFGALPWRTLGAFFGPVVLMMLLVYAWQRRWNRTGRLPVAAPAVRAISASFGNTVQVGIPLAAALFGEPGLALHIAIVSLHALVLLTVLTALVELDLARERHRTAPTETHLAATLVTTARNTVVHPVVLPVLCGLLWNATGWPLPQVIDDVLATLGQAVVPLCLLLIGMSLARHGVRGSAKGAGVISTMKLLVLPALVLAIGHWGMGLQGVPLAVVVMAASLPVGSNALIFSQRYDTQQGETTAAVVFSTLAFALTAPLWLIVLQAVS